MQGFFTILVTDTNRHVRDLLRRELTSEGYEVLVARDGKELVAHLRGEVLPDLIILDPELRDAGGLTVQKRLKDGACSIPVLMHGYSSEYPPGAVPMTAGAAFVEKTENTDVLKRVVRDILAQCRGNGPSGGPHRQGVDNTADGD